MSRPSGCKVPGCPNPHRARGFCNAHYKQARKADPTFTRDPRGTPSERFWRKVDKSADPDGCWYWTAFRDNDGYGMFGISGSNSVRAHRFAYEDLIGPIPYGMVLDHHCHNSDQTCPGGKECTHRACVRPDHLRLATVTTNVFTSRHTRAGQNAARDYCINGHPLFGDNLYIRPSNGERHCRICRRDRKRRYRAEAKAAREAETLRSTPTAA